VASWLALTVFVLFAEAQFFRQHLVMVVPPLALLFALRPPPTKWIVVVVIVCAPIQLFQLSDILVPLPYRGEDAELRDALRALPARARVVTDENGFVWQARHSTPPLFNDTSISRIAQGMITTRSVLDAAGARETCAVVIWSPRFGEALQGLRAGLEQHSYSLAREWAPNKQLWLKDLCDPANRAAARADRARAAAAPVRSRD
jgi:hypothetical protein